MNARIGGRKKKGQREIWYRVKDEVLNTEGRKLLDIVEDRGWTVMNGRVNGDENGEYTYVSHLGQSTIDYLIVNETGKENIGKLHIGELGESDHRSLEVDIIYTGPKFKKVGMRMCWNEGAIKEYKTRIENIEINQGNVNDMMLQLKQWIMNNLKWMMTQD